MRRILAGLFTTIVMGLMIWTSLGRAPSWSDVATTTSGDSRFQDAAAFPGATACIEALLAGARKGDVALYLSAFAGSLRERLEREAGERGREAFAVQLRRAGEARKSHAIFAPEPDADRPGSVRITLESTFADRLERQTFRLERADGRWLVTEIATAREHVPAKAPGSLATYDAPEGVPVDADSNESVDDSMEN